MYSNIHLLHMLVTCRDEVEWRRRRDGDDGGDAHGSLVARRRGDNAAHHRITDVSLGARYSELLPDHVLQLLTNRGCS